MSTARRISIFIVFLLIPPLVFAQQKPKIEIYLVDELPATQTGGVYFDCNTVKLATTPFIKDSEITGYEIVSDTLKLLKRKRFFLHLDYFAQQKVAGINKTIPLCCGQRFVITVDGKPTYGAYFWNMFSSWGSTWITVLAGAQNSLPLERGLPYDYFDNTHGDPRGDEKLLEAFRGTGRLTEK